MASDSYEPRIAFSSMSRWDESNPWSDARSYVVEWQPDNADALFIAGKDWNVVPGNFSKPIINLIQHPRHAESESELSGFLSRRAVRICVSQQVADAITQTAKVNGPVFVIPNGVSFDDIPPTADGPRPIEVLICGLKAPELARQIEQRLRQDENINVTSLVDWVPRTEYLDRLSRARLVVTLPRPTEGFYLPALEGMACGALLVCPDCVGNRDFCRDGVNCFRPQYDVNQVIAAIYRALGLAPGEAEKMRENAKTTAQEHSLERERSSFLGILERIDELCRG